MELFQVSLQNMSLLEMRNLQIQKHFEADSIHKREMAPTEQLNDSNWMDSVSVTAAERQVHLHCWDECNLAPMLTPSERDKWNNTRGWSGLLAGGVVSTRLEKLAI